ncbi:MAG TPA: Gmad2 immunoglobulin-like domain-containing protein [Candidatus Peribacteraceae bacterium]|nr:Gmad2 immunoglobulin-like domain-containing protein [Candidatus Peribacteraceae bacterium]
MRLHTLSTALLTLSLVACLSSTIDSFEDCVAAGYPIMESYPEQCRTPDGRTFVRQLQGSDVSDLVRLETPAAGDILQGEVELIGQARGNWYFEATFPISLASAEGFQVAQGYAEAVGNWMTSDWVPFQATISVPTDLDSATGTLVLHKSNASGLPEYDAALQIPVRFR